MVYFTVSEIADHIRKSKSSIYKLVMDKKIPHFKVGGTLLFDPIEVDSWVRSQSASLVFENKSKACSILKPRSRSE